MTLKHTFPSEDYHGVKVCACFCRAQGDEAVNETNVKTQNTVTWQVVVLWDTEGITNKCF